MRRTLVALILAFGAISSAPAQVSVGVGVNLPGVSIGINVPSSPQLVRVPSYPVYYASGVNANLFFYDGLYWVYESDNWYESSWYNGPWALIEPAYVPLYVLRVPVRYYRSPPTYFRDWRRDAPPRWGDHWGGDWSRQHGGWDRWNRSAAPAPAPLPVYQRQYTGNRYPRVEQQRALQRQNYRYQPRDAAVQQRVQQPAPARSAAPAAPPRQDRPHDQRPVPQAAPRAEAPAANRPPPPPRGHGNDPQAARPAERGPQSNAERAPQSHAAPPQPAPRQAPARAEPPAARAPAERGPGPGAQAPHENPVRGQGQAHGQGAGQEKDRGEGKGQDRKN